MRGSWGSLPTRENPEGQLVSSVNFLCSVFAKNQRVVSSIQVTTTFSLYYYFLHLKEICPCVSLLVLGMWDLK